MTWFTNKGSQFSHFCFQKQSLTSHFDNKNKDFQNTIFKVKKELKCANEHKKYVKKFQN